MEPTPSKRDEASIRANQLYRDATERGEALAWFEEIYAAAGGDAERVPWADEKPNPWLVEWLDQRSRSVDGENAVVVGCGLGDDAEELSRRGYQVVAFDLSDSAIEWAKRRFPESAVEYRQADLFALPEVIGTFDFVFEAYTLQALPIPMRPVAVHAVASLVAPGGELLVVCRGSGSNEGLEGPPWPLTRSELAGFRHGGLLEDSLDDFMDGEVRRWRVHYLRPAS
jgi:SAM-dependent methyltransferase